MKQQDYSATIQVNATAEEAFQKISRVNEWWAKNFEGDASHLNDTFKVTFGTTWVSFMITEFVPNKKIVWYVTDCHLPWLKDKKEWNGTKVTWEINTERSITTIQMTHIGLTPDVECYNTCEEGWNGHIKDSLSKLIMEGTGMPE